MGYAIEVIPSCKKSITKLCQRNPSLENALRRKIEEVIENPLRFKPLQHSFAGEYRVHILKSFVLIYRVDGATVRLLFFGHHDEAYRI